MISLPNIPTDNLYKFCFVGGIILLLFSGYLKFTSTNALTDIEESQDLIAWEMKQDSAQGAREKKIASIKSKYLDSNKKDLIKELDSLNSNSLRSMSRLESLYRKNLATLTKIKEGKNLNEYASTIRFIGVILTAVGAFGWYFRNQQVQDKLLAVQLKSAQIDLKLAEIKLEEQKDKEATKSDNLPES